MNMYFFLKFLRFKYNHTISLPFSLSKLSHVPCPLLSFKFTMAFSLTAVVYIKRCIWRQYMHHVVGPAETWQADYKCNYTCFEICIYKYSYIVYLCLDHIQVHYLLIDSPKTHSSRTRVQDDLRVYKSQQCKKGIKWESQGEHIQD